MDARELDLWVREARVGLLADKLSMMEAARATNASKESFSAVAAEYEMLMHNIRLGKTDEEIVADNWEDLKAIQGG